jgi:hypothetical protein
MLRMELKKATPLYLASTYAQFEVVQWLIDRGADPTVPGYRGMKALVRALFHSLVRRSVLFTVSARTWSGSIIKSKRKQ